MPASAIEPARPARTLRRATSARNPALKLARALHAKKVRRERRLLLAEGEDVVEAALDHGARPVAMLFDEERVGAADPLVAATSDIAERYLVSPALLAGASTLAAPPRVLAAVPQPDEPSFRDVPFPPSLGLLLIGVSDPGNVGTLVRTAAALGAEWVGLGPRSADPFHPRAVRASMGATFAIPLLIGVRAEDLATRDDFVVVAGVAHGGTAPWDVDLTQHLVLALGAERAGVGPALEALPEGRVLRVTIPQADGAESLNVSAAGAALMAEAGRQRGGPKRRL